MEICEIVVLLFKNKLFFKKYNYTKLNFDIKKLFYLT